MGYNEIVLWMAGFIVGFGLVFWISEYFNSKRK